MARTRARAHDRYEPVYRVIVAVDIEGFGRPDRDDPTRVMLRAVLDACLAEALGHAGVTVEPDQLSDLGDGRLLLLDGDVPKLRLLDAFVAALGASLARHNRWASPPARLRLRVAVSAGELLKDDGGWTGEALNTCFRLLDAAPVRAALRQADAPLALVVPDHLYSTLVRHAHGSLDPAAYAPIMISEKETTATAWIYLPGQPASATLALTSAADAAPPTPERPATPTAITQVVGATQIGSIHTIGDVQGNLNLSLTVDQAAPIGDPDG